MFIPILIHSVVDKDSGLVSPEYQTRPFFAQSLENYLTNLILSISPCKKEDLDKIVGLTLKDYNFIANWIFENTKIDKKSKIFKANEKMIENLKKNAENAKNGLRNKKGLFVPDFFAHWYNNNHYNSIVEGFSNILGPEFDRLIYKDNISLVNQKIKNRALEGEFLQNSLDFFQNDENISKGFKYYQTAYLRLVLIILSSTENYKGKKNKIKNFIKNLENFLKKKNFSLKFNFENKLNFLKKRGLDEVDDDQDKSINCNNDGNKDFEENGKNKKKIKKKRRKKLKNKFLGKIQKFLDGVTDKTNDLIEEEKEVDADAPKCQICLEEFKSDEVFCKLGKIHFSDVIFF